jgi:diguanylate cyclase (GGDEF)-like protein
LPDGIGWQQVTDHAIISEPVVADALDVSDLNPIAAIESIAGVESIRDQQPVLRVEPALDEVLPGSSTERVFRRTLLWYRHGVLAILIGIVWFALAPDLVGRTFLAGQLLVDLVVGGLALHLIDKRLYKERLSAIPWLEAAGLITLLAYHPNMSGVILMVALCLFSIGSALHGTWPATLATLAIVGASPVIAVVSHLSFDLPITLMLCVFIPAVGVIAERVQSNERSARRQYVDLLTGLDAIVWEGDATTMERTFVSPQSRDLLKLHPRALMDRWHEYVYPDDRQREAESRRLGVENERDFVIDFRMINGDGNTIFMRDTVRVERDSAGRPIRMRGVLVDVTRQQEAEATVRKQALYDQLTGLPNRSLFNDQLRVRLEHAKSSQDGLAVILLDLNGFKEVNDTLGHAVGDHLLQAIASRLLAYMGTSSSVARLGGDEFAVLIQPGNSATASAAAEQITACLTPPITVDEMTIQAGASVGIALYPNDGDDGASLLRRADAAMYEAKQSGRSHMFATPDDDVANVRRLQLLGELRASIASGDFRVYHQPKVDLKSGRVVGTEGLVRWQHKQFGLLTPAEFIELSELSGLIQPLTRYVLEQGIAQAAAWRAEGFEIAVAINLSVRNFFDQGLPAFIAELLERHRLPGQLLVLEITEREVMSDRALARSALASFRSLGVKISVDDFGTGFSSLSQLQQLPIDEIKIDASFVKNMLTDQQDAVIVKSIIDLGHNLGLEVVAEGAETPGELKALREMGADRVQGYVISKPIPAEDFTRWLRRLDGRPEDPSVPVKPVRPAEAAPRSSRLLAKPTNGTPPAVVPVAVPLSVPLSVPQSANHTIEPLFLPIEPTRPAIGELARVIAHVPDSSQLAALERLVADRRQ